MTKKYFTEPPINNDTVSFDYPEIYINLAGTNPYINISPEYIHVSLINNTTNILTYTINNAIPIEYIATDLFIISKYNNFPKDDTLLNDNVNNINGELIIKHSIKHNNLSKYPSTIFSGFFLKNGGGNHVKETGIDRIIKLFSNKSASATIHLNNDIDRTSPYICANLKNNIPTMILFTTPIQINNNIVISNKTDYDIDTNTLYINRISDNTAHNVMNNIYIKYDYNQKMIPVIEGMTVIEGAEVIDSPGTYMTCTPVDDTDNKINTNVYTILGSGKTLKSLYASNTMNLVAYFSLFVIILGFEILFVPTIFNFWTQHDELVPLITTQDTESNTEHDINAKYGVITVFSIIFLLIIVIFFVVGYVIKSIHLTITALMIIFIYIITGFILMNNWKILKIQKGNMINTNNLSYWKKLYWKKLYWKIVYLLGGLYMPKNNKVAPHNDSPSPPQ
jgi:hypothetical protein